MAKVRCPYCEGKFQWPDEAAAGRIQCPLCNKAVKMGSRRSGKGQQPSEAGMHATTSWGTDGFDSRSRTNEYGEIKKGDLLGGFRIEEIVGAGAMAVVYRATQLSLDRSVALKILPKAFAERESFVRQFDSETELLASLNHANIVSIIDRGREGDTYYFAMEFVEGTTLGELVAAGEVTEEFFLQIVEQCCQALSYAHSKGIIHRDIKPANIMLNDQGVVKIADFGVAGLIAEAADTVGKRRVMGTRGYMPPEQEIHINRTDERSDIFALGAVMYRVLTNTISDFLPPDPPSKVNPAVDPRLGMIVMTCLEANPERRYQTGQEMLEAIQAYHREITRAHELCPECKKENPPRQKTCMHCGADLSALFDACPECETENRVDVDLCMGCGISLGLMRQRTSVRISKTEERARHLASRSSYDEAIAELQRVVEVKGKIFQRARDKAERMIASYKELRERYYEQKIEEGRRLAEEGTLKDALETLESVPEDVGGPHSVQVLVLDVKSRMAEARQKLEGLAGLLEQKAFDEADALLDAAAAIWADCPGLEDGRRQVHSSRETVGMVEYEIQAVEEHLEKGQLTEARQSIEFAMATMPDNPRVQELRAEITRREKAALLTTALKSGKQAFEEKRFSAASQFWASALDMMPPDDARRAKLEENIRIAGAKALEMEVIALEEARVARLHERGKGPDRGISRTTLIGAFVGVLVAMFVAAGYVLWLLFAT